jgi:hypothetical protein
VAKARSTLNRLVAGSIPAASTIYSHITKYLLAGIVLLNRASTARIVAIMGQKRP